MNAPDTPADHEAPTMLSKPGHDTASGTTMQIGKFNIVSQLGRGGMGVVHLAEDPTLQRKVAIKTLNRMEGESEVFQQEMAQRFFREARAAARLNHPNVVGIHEMGTSDDGVHYIAMEYAEGQTLAQIIRSTAPLTLDETVRIMVQACAGLEAIHHSGLVHRDIKPANIMVTPQGEAKIMDFGIVRADSSEMTRTQQILGTLNYMSPEQIQSSRSVDHRSDLFSLGVILYEMLTGEKAFPGRSMSSVSWKIVHENPTLPSNLHTLLPKDVDRIVQRSLLKSPQDRYGSCGALAADLRALVPDEGSPFSTGQHPPPALSNMTPSSSVMPPSVDEAITMPSGKNLSSHAPEALQEVIPGLNRFYHQATCNPLRDRHTAFSIGLLTFGISDFLIMAGQLRSKTEFLNRTVSHLPNKGAEGWSLEAFPIPIRSGWMKLALWMHGLGMLALPVVIGSAWWMVHNGAVTLFAASPLVESFSTTLYVAIALTTLGGNGFLLLAWDQARRLDRVKRDLSDAWGSAWPPLWRANCEQLKPYDGPLFMWILVTALFVLANLFYVVRLFDMLFIAHHWDRLTGPIMLLQASSIPLLIVLLTAMVFNMFHTVLGMTRRYLWDKDTLLPKLAWNWGFSLSVFLWLGAVVLMSWQRSLAAIDYIF
ncbi:MAG: serine/threonine protein kinase [Magnetococcales bacterium]|nr:serine/threonine protein kinase [Magnetococcales bacterium]